MPTFTFSDGVELAFDPNQPRDERGRWTSGAGGGGEIITASAADIERHERLFGANDIDALFNEALRTSVPFPSARRLKTEPRFDSAKITELLKSPPVLTSIDPRALRSNQPSVTRDGVAYYMTDEYAISGRTFADGHDAGNKFPIVQVRERTGEHIIVSGHHRATAALLRGENLQVRLSR